MASKPQQRSRCTPALRPGVSFGGKTVDHDKAAVAHVGDVHVARRRDRKPGRSVQNALPPGYRGDDPRARHAPDHVVAGVSDVDISIWPDRQTPGKAQPGVIGRATVSAVAVDIVAAGDGRDPVRPGFDSPNSVAPGVGNQDVTAFVDRDRMWVVQHRVSGRSLVAGRTRLALACEPAQDAVGGTYPSRIAGEIRDVERAVRRERETDRLHQRRSTGYEMHGAVGVYADDPRTVGEVHGLAVG